MINKKIVVTGGAGSIGSELVRQLVKENSVYVLDNNESGLFDIMQETDCKGRVGDIRDYATVREVFSDIKPDIVFHAAALKHVPLMEYVPKEAIQTNVIGTWNVVQAAQVQQTPKLVYISTDKVVNAKSIMGQTKKLGETIVTNAGYTAVRFGNVMGSRGSVLEIWRRQHEQGRPLTLTDERMTRYMMTVREAVALVIEAANTGEVGGVLVLDMGAPISLPELLAKVYPHDQVEIIGIRPGEVLEERLMTQEEEARAVKQGKYFVIK